MSQFNEDYYERGVELNISGYSNYRWIPELTIPLAFRIIECLNLKPSETVLDYGCAKGYLVHALRLLHREAYGYDISEYALENCPPEVHKHLFSNIDFKTFDWVICKDVLEHVPYEAIDDVLQDILSHSKNYFIVVPLGKDGKYEVPSYDHDLTHVIKEPIEWWCDKFKQNGFTINHHSYRMKHIKENYASWEKGNGFFILGRD
jgi:2-polyprenyl-3-methyl-5-hydroxy-6-metoxy-1,4-benzoquinol methylase